VLDAFATGIPVLASDRGGLPGLVGAAGFDPDDVEGWAEALRELWEDPQRRQGLGMEALRRGGELLGEGRYYERLMGVYAGTG
jgi:glycosyltransferase involved in cell wall biosynthesis